MCADKLGMSDKVSYDYSTIVNRILCLYLHAPTCYIVDHHDKMENTTTRLAVQIENYPPFPFSWDDNTPQKPRSELTEEEILPNEDDGHHLYQRMVKFMMEFRSSPVSPYQRTSSNTQNSGNANEASLS